MKAQSQEVSYPVVLQERVGASRSSGKASGAQGEVDSLLEGGAEALDKFYRCHADRVLGWAIRLGGPHVDPEDIAQEVFAVALKRLDTYQGNASISTWLFGITRKIVANARRRASLRRMVGLHDPSSLPSRAALADEDLERYRLRHKVQTALHRLKKNHREVLVLVDLEGLPASEVATMLHIPVGTVYSRLHHARRAFAVVLKRMGLVHHRARTTSSSSSGPVGSGITRKDKRR